jgi:hypothetical protein
MIRAFLDASSVHLSAGTCAWLDAQPGDDVLRDPTAEPAAQIGGEWTRHGWFVHALEHGQEGFPPDLRAALRTARAQGVEDVLFACDAPPGEDLPVPHPGFPD